MSAPWLARRRRTPAGTAARATHWRTRCACDWWRCSCCWRWPWPRPSRSACRRRFGIGWRDAARPLVVDYVDRLAARDRQPAQHRARPGPGAAPAGHRAHQRPAGQLAQPPREPGSASARWNDDQPPGAQRRAATCWSAPRPTATASTSASTCRPGKQRPRVIGWATLAALLLLTALAYLYVRRLLRPLDDIRAGALRFGAGDFAQPIPVRHAAPARRTGRTGRHHQHHGRRHPPDARRQARAAAGHQPRTAQPADPRPPEHRAAARNARRAARAARPCCATWARCAT